MNQDRRSQIVELINTNGTVKNEELMQKFGISIETVRRDLDYLEKQGFLEKVYGGAVKKTLLSIEPSYINRENVNPQEKRAIAYEAEKWISDGESIFFDLGTTVLFLAQQLGTEKKINAFTNAVRTAVELCEKGCNVVIPGGKMRAKELSVSGTLSQETMCKFNVDTAFIGVGGITSEGISDYIPEEASLRRQIIKNASRVIVLADYSKFGVRSLCNVCDAEDIDILITDKKAPKQILKELEKKGIRVILTK